MVDVSDKAETAREAVAVGAVRMSAAARRAIRQKAVKKGDPLSAARLAGIMAAKRTADLIPLCHQVPLTTVEVDIEPRATGYAIVARVATMGRTGVEMEALVAVSAAALTLYDMLKAVDRGMTIGPFACARSTAGEAASTPGRRENRACAWSWPFTNRPSGRCRPPRFSESPRPSPTTT
jgi:cyclic pyranopterin phosphate synthase